MQIKVLLNSPMGKVFISILLGLGLATMFRTVCEEKNCIRFFGPVISEIDGKIYKHGDKCYKYESESSGKCDANKKILDIRVKPKEGEFTIGGLL
jgi:hypothetical protein